MVGSSGRDDVQTFYDNVIGFNHTRDFFADYSLAYAEGLEMSNVPDVYSTGYAWVVDETDARIITALDSKSDKLAEIVIGWSVDSTRKSFDLSPQSVVTTLGKPSWMFAKVFKTLIPQTAEARLLIVYESGFSFFSFASIPVVTDARGEFARYCFSDPSVQESGAIYITNSFTNGLQEMSPLQAATVGERIQSYELSPFDQVFNTSLDEFVKLTVDNRDVCLDVNLP